MILEAALASKTVDRLLTKEARSMLNTVRHTVKRFTFDTDASYRHGVFAIECADIVCQQSQFAVAPFPNTYIEIDNHAALTSGQEVAPDAAKRLGFLFTETGDIYCLSGDERRADFNPFVYNHAGTGVANMPAGYHTFKRNLMLGQVSEGLRDGVDHFAHRLTDVWDVSLTMNLPRNIFDVMVTECAGSLKRALAAVLMLHQRKLVRLREIAPTRGLVNGKMRTYAAHSLVSLDVSGDPLELRRSIGKTDIHMRRHEVRGHYVHYDVSQHCDHDWTVLRNETLMKRDIDRVGKEIARWSCNSCGGRRVFREAHYRGDAGLGYVSKNYEVNG